MNLAESLLGYRSFSSEIEVLQKIEDLETPGSSGESTTHARSLLIFETSRQHTWLVSTGERLYFVLDDVRRPAPLVKRSVPRNDLKTQPDGSIAVNVQSKSASTGLVDVGLRRRGWLYSNKLFSRRSIEHAIHGLFAEGNAPEAPAGQAQHATH